ncbi:MAG: PQQ-like beta-propeller repeat protein [Planctomycetes bacterium]|nr:PQQ-like beta-propeller repeat protein [Planctomycetota bacterium]
MRQYSLIRFLSVAMIFVGATIASADNWPQWRGPTNDGISKETGLPTSFGVDKNLAWKLTLPGRGSSTPIIWGDRIYLTGPDKGELQLWCISTAGKLLWQRPISSVIRKDVRNGEGNEASPTPSTDGKNVFTYVGTGEMAAFDMDGKEIWKFNAQKRYGRFSIQHGMHITPLLHGDRLYFALLTNGGHWVVAIDKATGKEAWKIARPSDARSESREAYTSPVLWKNGDELNLVVLGCDYTTGHRLDDGKELWRLGDLNPKNSPAHRIIASPVATSDLLIVPTCRGLVVSAVKQGAKGTFGAGSSMEQWRISKGSPDVPCPLAHDGLVYLQRENGLMIVLDQKTGKEVYQERLNSERYRSSPIFADGKIYTIGRDSGTVSVLKAGRKFQVLATNRLPDNITASPAVSGGRLYIRGFQTLYAFSDGGK